MAFFLGKDVSITCSTENTSYGLQTTTAGAYATADATTGFADALSTGAPAGATGSWHQMTSVELSIGAMDEDISYFGMRSVTKAEIKKETTITLTRKKTSELYDVLFNEARFGVTGTTALDGLSLPTVTKGYRIFVTMEGEQGTDEVITLMGCCITGHTVSMGVDGTMDETLELMTYITPSFGTTKDNDAIGTAL